MTTDNDTPAVAILGSLFASVAANVSGTPVETSMEEEFVDNDNLTLGNNDDYTLSDKMVHYCGGQILQVHWSACKAVLAFYYAGLRVSKGKTTKSKSLTLNISTRMLVIFSVTPSRRRKNPCLPTLFGVTTTTPQGQKFAGILLVQYFPKELVTMKSGRGFHESCNEVYVKAYCLGMANAKFRGGALKYHCRGD